MTNPESDSLSLSLSAYVGQEAIKQALFPLIEGVKRHSRPLPHLLFCGSPEMGKGTLAHAIAYELQRPIRAANANQIETPADLAAILTNLDAGELFLVKEIELLKEPTFNILLEAVEDLTLELVFKFPKNKYPKERERRIKLDLRPFTLIGTTSKPSQVDKRLRRWLIAYDFVSYDLNQMSEIIMLLAKQQGLPIDPAAGRLLAEYCEGTVGNALVLLKRIRTYANASTAVTYDMAREALVAFHYLEQPSTSVDLPTKLRKMTGPEFEEFVASIFRDQGYTVEITPGSGDHGIDLLMRKENQIVAVQCKRWNAPVGEPVIRDFFGSLVSVKAQRGYVVTTSSFTTQAIIFTQNKPVQLIDLNALVNLTTRGK